LVQSFNRLFFDRFLAPSTRTMGMLVCFIEAIGMVTFSFAIVFHSARQFFITVRAAMLIFVRRAELIPVPAFRGLSGERL